MTRRSEGDGELHLLTGAYAADALDDDERHTFERHLAACPACAEEVRELRATGARLAEAVAEPPPSHLWEQVQAAVEQVRQLPPALDAARARRAGRRTTRLLAVAAAALLVVAVAFGSMTVSLERRLARDRAAADQVAAVLTAPDARALPARPGGRGSAMVMMSPTRGQAVFAAGSLPDPGRSRSYQLWVIGAGGPRPAGILHTGPGGRAAQMVQGSMAGATQVALTVEPEGGSRLPTTAPVTVVDLTA